MDLLFSRNPITNKCIILDLDETLVHTFTDMQYLSKLGILSKSENLDIRSRCYILKFQHADHSKNKIISEGSLWGIRRPHLQEFLDFCFKYFKIVAVWSAGKYDYVHHVVDQIFANTYRPDIIYSRPDCVGPIGNLEKPISKMINENPQLQGVMTLENTFILDDRTISFAQDPGNGILIPPYTPENHKEIPVLDKMRTEDITFYKLMSWLSNQEVSQTKNVRLLDKHNIWNINPSTTHTNIINNDENLILFENIKPNLIKVRA